MLSREKANKPTEDESLLLSSTKNSQPTLSLLTQLKQQNKPDKLGPTPENEPNSDTMLKAWGGSHHKNISSTQRHDAESLQSVLQNFSLAQNDRLESEKNRYSDSVLVSSAFYSADGPQTTCLTPNMTQVQQDCISSSWEMPQGGPLGEILTNSKISEDSSKCGSRSYGWLLNLDHAPWFLNPWRAWHRYLTTDANNGQERKMVQMTVLFAPCMLVIYICTSIFVASSCWIISSSESGCILKIF
jgi:hypothetical protein